MKKLLFVNVFVLFAIAQIIVACKEEQMPPSLELQTNVVNVEAKGGRYSVSYEIVNPDDGAEVSVEYSSEWIGNFNTEIPGVVSFDVFANETQEERSTDVNILYPGVSDVVRFTVIQEANEILPFTINVNEVSEISVNLDIIPEDKEMTYINFTTPSEYAPDDDDALFNEDMAYFQQISDINNVSLEEVIASYTTKGELMDQNLLGLIPGTDYVTYAYGIDLSTNKRTTDIVRAYYSTVGVEVIDVSFDFDCYVNGGFVNLTITPENYDGYYAYEVYGGVTEDINLDELCEQNWTNTVAFFLSVGYSYEDIMNEFCKQGQYSLSLSLDAETEYVVVAHAVNEKALKCSETSYEFFNTGTVAPSDNVIDIAVSNIKDRSLDLKVTTTNLDPYVIYISQSKNLEEYTSDEEIMNYFTNKSNPNINSGGFTETITNLIPNTDYSLCAFGYNAGTYTTDLFRVDCKTTEAEKSDVKVELLFEKYYDAGEVAELDPSYSDVPDGFAILPVTAIPDPGVIEYYYDLFATMFFESVQLTEDELISQLVSAGSKPSEFVYLTNYDLPSVLVSVAKDADGNFGPLWYSEEFTLTKDGTSDPNEFVSISENRPSNIDENQHSISHLSSINQVKKDKSSITKEDSTTKFEELTKYIFNVDSTKNLKKRRSIIF